MQGIERTVVSQYGNSPVLLAIINAFNDAIDPAADFELFYDQIWNLDTASGYGLDLWGRIVDVSRTLSLTVAQTSFGFNTKNRSFAPFGQAPFVSSANVTRNFRLEDEPYRRLILAKAAANICACSAPVLNMILTSLFGDQGRCYVTDYGHMMMRFTFEFFLNPTDFAILTQSGVMPKPAGVTLYVAQLPPRRTFGFAEAGRDSSAPFGQAPMLSTASIIVAVAQQPGI